GAGKWQRKRLNSPIPCTGTMENTTTYIGEREASLTGNTARIACLQPQQYLTLLELSKAIASHRNLSDLFHDLSERLRHLFNFQYLGVMLHDDAKNVMRLHIMETSEPAFAEVPTEIPIEGSISGWVWQSQQALVIHDIEQETRF